MTVGDEGSDPDDRLLLADLAALWQRLDPAPADLADRCIAAIESASLAEEYELLTLTARDAATLGMRSHAGRDDGPTMIEFTGEGFSCVVRVGIQPDGRRRIDGWLAPAGAGPVRLRRDGVDREATADPNGRFTFLDVPAGVIGLRFSSAGHPRATPDFTV